MESVKVVRKNFIKYVNSLWFECLILMVKFVFIVDCSCWCFRDKILNIRYNSYGLRCFLVEVIDF